MQFGQLHLIGRYSLAKSCNVASDALQSQLRCDIPVNHAWIGACVDQDVLVLKLADTPLNHDQISLIQGEGNFLVWGVIDVLDRFLGMHLPL